MTTILVAYKDLVNSLRHLRRNEDGAAAIEYGLIIAGIALAIVGAVFAIGEDLAPMFETLAAAVESGQNQIGQ